MNKGIGRTGVENAKSYLFLEYYFLKSILLQIILKSFY